MAESTQYNLTDAALPNGTIDFYTLLGAAPTASEDDLRSRIQAIYSESQANRDHRNLNKRREYQTLLELLPAARTALLEAPKRSKYDQYLETAKQDRADVDFETFMSDLMGGGEAMEDKTALLGTAERRAEPRVKVIKTTTSVDPKTTASSSSSKADGPPMGIIGAVVGLVIGFVTGHFLLHSNILAILLALVLAVVGFVALNRKPGGKIGV